MKVFWKKYGLAIVITLLLIAALLWLGLSVGLNVSNSRYYEKWIVDDTDLLSNETEETLAKMIRVFDQKYGCILGLVISDDEVEQNISEQAFALQQSYGYGKNDLMLLVSPKVKKHYLADGDAISQLFPNELRIKLLDVFTDDAYEEDRLNKTILLAYDLAEEWFDDNVPQHMGGRKERNQPARGAEVLLAVLLVLISLFAVICLFRYFVYPLFCYPTLGRWKPLWGWSVFGPFGRKK